MKEIKNTFIIFFSLKGSWKWACKQMQAGKIIRRLSSSGTVKYKLDNENQGRILWTFERNPKKLEDWDSANVFMEHFTATDWVVFK